MGVTYAQQLVDALTVVPGDVVAFVGGGGKTSAVFRLGHELAARGVPVLLSGTTRFTGPDTGLPPNLVLIGAGSDVPPVPGHGPWPLTLATGWGSKDRLLPVPAEWVAGWHAARPELCIVLEADGSAMRPFKAPADHEPVIPPSATLVVPVVGIDVIGRSLDRQHVHRPELVAGLAGAALGQPVDTRMIAAVLAHPDGGRRGVPAGARWLPLINKVDTPERMARARALAMLLREHAHRVVITRLRHDPPVVAVL